MTTLEIKLIQSNLRYEFRNIEYWLRANLPKDLRDADRRRTTLLDGLWRQHARAKQLLDAWVSELHRRHLWVWRARPWDVCFWKLFLQRFGMNPEWKLGGYGNRLLELWVECLEDAIYHHVPPPFMVQPQRAGSSLAHLGGATSFTHAGSIPGGGRVANQRGPPEVASQAHPSMRSGLTMPPRIEPPTWSERQVSGGWVDRPLGPLARPGPVPGGRHDGTSSRGGEHEEEEDEEDDMLDQTEPFVPDAQDKFHISF